MLRGYLDRVEFVPAEGWCAVGWAFDEGGDESVKVELTSHGQVVGTAVADQYREDLAENNIGTGNHGFIAKVTLEVLTIDVSSVRLGLRRAGSTDEICAEASQPINALLGQLEGHRNMIVYGWACDSVSPDTPLSIDILVDGQLADRVIADQQRGDLLSYFSSGRGFFWPMPDAFADGRTRLVSARVTNRPMLLSGSPLEVTVGQWQVPLALQQQLRRRQSMREELKAIDKNLFYQRWQSPAGEVVGIGDFLRDRSPLNHD